MPRVRGAHKLAFDPGKQAIFAHHLSYRLFTANKLRLFHDVAVDLAVSVDLARSRVEGPRLFANRLPLLLAPRRSSGHPLVVAAGADLQDPAQESHRELPGMFADPGVLQRLSFAKYAAAFFRISFSIRRRRLSLRSSFSSSASGTGCEAGGNLPAARNLRTHSPIDHAVAPRRAAASRSVYPCSTTSFAACSLSSWSYLFRVPMSCPPVHRRHYPLHPVSGGRGAAHIHQQHTPFFLSFTCTPMRTRIWARAHARRGGEKKEGKMGRPTLPNRWPTTRNTGRNVALCGRGWPTARPARRARTGPFW